jgi:hypothetical protein
MPIVSQEQAKLLGIPKDKLVISHILFPKADWTIVRAREWLKKHKTPSLPLKFSKYKSTPMMHRFLQSVEIEGAKFVTKILPNGVEFVFQKY